MRFCTRRKGGRSDEAEDRVRARAHVLRLRERGGLLHVPDRAFVLLGLPRGRDRAAVLVPEAEADGEREDVDRGRELEFYSRALDSQGAFLGRKKMEEKAGRELDARVAVEVMGYKQLPVNWFPSTDIAAAWEVADKVVTGYKAAENSESLADRATARQYDVYVEALQEDDVLYRSAAEAAAGICRAALKAVRS